MEFVVYCFDKRGNAWILLRRRSGRGSREWVEFSGFLNRMGILERSGVAVRNRVAIFDGPSRAIGAGLAALPYFEGSSLQRQMMEKTLSTGQIEYQEGDMYD